MSELTPQNLTHAYHKERFLYIINNYSYSLTYLFSLTNSEQTNNFLFSLSRVEDSCFIFFSLHDHWYVSVTERICYLIYRYVSVLMFREK